MLFRPVYGPELQAIYELIANQKQGISRRDIYQLCQCSLNQDKVVSTQNIDDALSFLLAAYMITEEKKTYFTVQKKEDLPFQLQLLNNLYALMIGTLLPKHELDRLYFFLLDQLFIKPNNLYLGDLHTVANKLHKVANIGGLSQEKIRSWKRVMTFLGLGQRVAGGFQCTYSPEILLNILNAWFIQEGFLQILFEQHMNQYLPVQTQSGELTIAAHYSLRYLQDLNYVEFKTYPDASFKPYFRERWNYISILGKHYE